MLCSPRFGLKFELGLGAHLAEDLGSSLVWRAQSPKGNISELLELSLQRGVWLFWRTGKAKCRGSDRGT
jgi:hypothetical protein